MHFGKGRVVIEQEALRVAVASPGEKYSLLEFDQRCARVRAVVNGILGPMKLRSRLLERLDFRKERSWLVYAIRCSGQTPLAFELEHDLNARAVLDGEVGSAKALCEQYFSVLRNLLAQASVSGMELGEFKEQLPDMHAFEKAFRPRNASNRALYQLESGDEVPFELSALPGRFLGKESIQFAFRVRTVGPAEAKIRLARSSRARLASPRRDIDVNWEPKPGDRSISTMLFTASHTGVELTGTGRCVYRSTGKLAGIVIQRLDDERQLGADIEASVAIVKVSLEPELLRFNAAV
jgi:hypothetical protein